MLPYREKIEDAFDENKILLSINHSNHPGIMAETHWHPCFEIQHVICGTAIQTIDDTTFVMQTGDTLFIPSGAAHTTSTPSDTCEIYVILFALEKNIPEIHLLSGSPIPFIPLLSKLRKELVSPQKNSSYISLGILLQILGYILRDGNPLTTAVISNEGQKLDTYLRSHLLSGLTLQNVANHYGYSTSYFSKYFHDLMGSSFRDYCESLKLQAARQMLSDGYSVNETAQILHYHNPSSFSRAFKRCTGYTPSEYQTRQKMNQEP